jgi:hypothetical protein
MWTTASMTSLAEREVYPLALSNCFILNGVARPSTTQISVSFYSLAALYAAYSSASTLSVLLDDNKLSLVGACRNITAQRVAFIRLCALGIAHVRHEVLYLFGRRFCYQRY